MSVSLNEFTTEQLQVLLNVVVAKIIDEDLHHKEWLKYFADDENMYYAYWGSQPERLKEYETLQLFRVQILNAIAEVRMKEDILSN